MSTLIFKDLNIKLGIVQRALHFISKRHIMIAN